MVVCSVGEMEGMVVCMKKRRGSGEMSSGNRDYGGIETLMDSLRIGSMK